MFSTFILFVCVNLSPSAVEKVLTETPCLTAFELRVIGSGMKKRWAVGVFFAGSLLGGLIGYSSRPAAARLGSEDEITLKNRRDREKQVGMTAHPQKWQSLAKRVTTFSSEERKGFLKELAPTDRGMALEALMSQAGPGSTSGLVTSMMDKILESWAAEDFESTLSFCQKCTNDGMRKYMLGQLLETLVETDPDRAIQLFARQKVEDPLFESDMLSTLAGTRMGESAAQLVDLMSKFPATSEYDGAIVKFSSDYDFQAAAAGIMAVIKANPGKSPAVLPINLMKSWAAVDPDAAHAWWVKNGSFSFNSWDSLLDGVEKHGDLSSAAWALAKLEEPGAPRQKMITDLSADQVLRIAKATPDVTAQDRFLTEVVRENANPFSEPFRGAISGLSSPQARLAAFQESSKKISVTMLKYIDDSEFQAWGITRQQVELIVEPK
jgi:hypothetical protein